MPWVQELIDIIKRQRKHASFFEWPQKDTKELGVLKCLMVSLEKAGCSSYSVPQSTLKDPPDCVAKDASGKLVGIEISEFVDLKTVRDAQHSKEYPKYWDKKEIIERTQSIILKKNRKKFHGGPYSKIFLIIFTDETFLDPDDAIQYLMQHEFKRTNQIDEIYFLFSYDPRYHTYPYIKLKTADNIRVEGTSEDNHPCPDAL